tara:strand:+ start:956 stop:1150 length:195 start_codon:yes stop_codon:yes gene_type:complete
MVADGAKKLKEAWQRARYDWDDEVARRYEAEFLEPLAPKIRTAVEAMDHLASIAARADRATAPD